MKTLNKSNMFKYFNWVSVIVVSVIVIFVFVFMEWIFLITKPSFMSTISPFEKISTFFVTGALLSILYFLLISIFWFLSYIKIKHFRNFFLFLSLLIPSFLIAVLILLMIDNFTYTVFRYGIVTSFGIFRALYGFLCLILFFISFKEIRKITLIVENKFKKSHSKFKTIFLPGILLIIIIFVGITPVVTNFPKNFVSNDLPISEKLPHIFLITPDGVNAENMSVYGYERETTPFINEIAKSSLIAQNAFTNSANTSGSIISIFTSKYPIETHVLYPPDILKSEDAYQHLPAILKLNGYYTAQFSFDHYVDAYQLNVQNGFDEANGRSNQNIVLNKINRWLPTNIGYFIYELSNRLIDRIRHIFFIKKMTNPFLEIVSPEDYNDKEKIGSLIDLIDNSNKPIFAHIHWMGTHGAKFFPSQPFFSVDKDPDDQLNWDIDFYDDSILEFDQAIENFCRELENRNLLDSSIIIIASDHGQNYKTNKRLPLIVRFPDGEFQKSIINNVQNMDISPTILDYLNIGKPQWMEGISLLGEIPQQRPIYAVGIGGVERENNSLKSQSIKPPFYQFGFSSVIVCDYWFGFDLGNYILDEQRLSNYVGLCDDKKISETEGINLIIDFFEQYEYDTSSIEIKLIN